MAPSSSLPRKDSLPPPMSLTACWDKAKWHFESSSFPEYLPRNFGCVHIVAALRFLDERGQLTASGKAELAELDEEIALLNEQIKAPARAFLDQNYEAYLRGINSYDQPPPLHILETAWEAYAAKYDLSKKPTANAYQKLLLNHACDRSVDALLRALDRVPDLPARLRGSLAYAPTADRSLIAAALAARETDPVTLATSWPDPVALLHALRYLDHRRHALARLRASLVLANRIPIGNAPNGDLASLVYAMNLGATPEAEAAWHCLAEPEKDRLAEAVNALFASGQETHLALCVMRTVGDLQSLKLIEQSIGNKGEGVTQDSDGRCEPSWEPVRHDAREAIRRRHNIQ